MTRLADDLRFLFSRTPCYVVFHVTDRCHLNCAHCFKNGDLTPASEELSLTEIDRVSASLGHIKYLTLAGGEPLLRKDLSEIVGIFYRNNALHFLNLVTNGWFTDRAVSFLRSVMGECPGLKINVGVSVDGPEAVHDHIRRQQGSFQRALDTLTDVNELALQQAQERLFLLAHGTYNALNADHLYPVAQYFAETAGIPYSIGLIRGRSRDSRCQAIDIDHYVKTQADVQMLMNSTLHRHFPFRQIRLGVEALVARIVYESYANNRCMSTCHAGRRGIVIEADGNLPLCEMKDMSLGNVRANRYDIMQVLKRRKARQAIEKVRQQQCHCTWECFQRLNIVFTPRLYPEILRHSLHVLGRG